MVGDDGDDDGDGGGGGGVLQELVDDGDEMSVLTMAAQQAQGSVIPTVGVVVVAAAACSAMTSKDLPCEDRGQESREDEEPKKKKRRKSRAKHPPRPVVSKVQLCTDEVLKKSDAQFFLHLRVTKTTFAFLYELVERQYRLETQSGSQSLFDSRSSLAMTLRYFGGNCTYVDIAREFETCRSTVHVYVQIVIHILCVVASRFVCWPKEDKVTVIEAGFRRLGGLDGVVGVLGDCRINIKSPIMQAHKYLDKNNMAAMHLLAVCDHTSAFTYINIGQPGSAEESEVLKSTTLYGAMEKQPDALFPSDRFHIVADSIYPASKYLQVPAEDVGMLSAEEKELNQQLLQAQTVIERAFTQLKARFCRLNYIDAETKTIPNLVKACCILHNITLRFPEEQVDLTDDADDSISLEASPGDSSLSSVLD